MTALSAAWQYVRRPWWRWRPWARAYVPPRPHSGVQRSAAAPWAAARRPSAVWPSMLPLAPDLARQLAVRAHVQAAYALADMPVQRALAAAGWPS